MPYGALSTLMAECYCLRLMPNNAAYANVVILAKIKVDTTILTTPKLIVRHQAVVLNQFIAKNEFSSLVESLRVIDPDEDGWVTYPLFGMYILGRGIYGNTYRMRVSAAPQADSDNGYKNYIIEILDSEGGLTRKEIFTGSFNTEATYNNETLSIEDLINSVDKGSNKVGLYVSERSFAEILNIYNASVAVEPVTIDTFDIITGKDLSGLSIGNILISNTEVDTPLDRIDGVVLSGGTDGTFSTNGLAGVREQAIDNEYINAFTNNLVIRSKRRTPAELILDANYSNEVKRALINLITTRYDAKGFIDSGILESGTDAIEYAESMSSLGDRIFSKECQHYYIKDPFGGKNIPMTITYFLATHLPIHLKTNGNHIPFVGKTYAKLSGHVYDSLKPNIDADDNGTKEALYNLRVNYFETIGEDNFIRGVQGTSQNVWSDLSEEHNMYVLLELKRIIEDHVASKRYNFAEVEDRNSFTEMADRLISPYRGKKLRTATVYFAMSPFEELRSILHCYLASIFKTINKRGIVEIDINKRV